MDSTQRVKSALTHNEPDRIPLDIGGTRVSGIHEQAYQRYRQELGMPSSKPEMKVRYLRIPKIDEDFNDFLEVDLESVDPKTANEDGEVEKSEDGLKYIDRWKCEWFMHNNAAYFDLKTHPLAEIQMTAELDNYNWPISNSENILNNLKNDAETVKIHERAILLGRTCPGIFEMLSVLCGTEKAMLDLAMNPGLSEAIMDRVLEYKLNYYETAIEKIISTGVDFFIVGESDDLGSQSGLLISPEMYRSMIKPRHTHLFTAIKDFSKGKAFIELHCCGAIRELIPDLIESGIEILNPIQVSAEEMDTQNLKKDFGNDIVFHGGGIDSQKTLPYGNTEEIRDEVKRRIEDLAPGGGFIFTPVHSIQHDVPFENFMAMVDTFREYS